MTNGPRLVLCLKGIQQFSLFSQLPYYLDVKWNQAGAETKVHVFMIFHTKTNDDILPISLFSLTKQRNSPPGISSLHFLRTSWGHKITPVMKSIYVVHLNMLNKSCPQNVRSLNVVLMREATEKTSAPTMGQTGCTAAVGSALISPIYLVQGSPPGNQWWVEQWELENQKTRQKLKRMAQTRRVGAVFPVSGVPFFHSLSVFAPLVFQTHSNS